MFKTYYKTKSKAERKAWWNSLTSEEQGAYINKKQCDKAHKRAMQGYNELKLESEAILHLNSITAKDYTIGVVK